MCFSSVARFVAFVARVFSPVVSVFSVAASTFLRQLFESDYPKLVRVFSDLISRLDKFGGSASNAHPYGGGKDPSRYEL